MLMHSFRVAGCINGPISDGGEDEDEISTPGILRRFTWPRVGLRKEGFFCHIFQGCLHALNYISNISKTWRKMRVYPHIQSAPVVSHNPPPPALRSAAYTASNEPQRGFLHSHTTRVQRCGKKASDYVRIGYKVATVRSAQNRSGGIEKAACDGPIVGRPDRLASRPRRVLQFPSS